MPWIGHREDHRCSSGGGTHSGVWSSFSDSLLSGISFTQNTCLRALQGTSEVVWPGGRSPGWRRAGPILLCDQRKQVPPSGPAGILNPNHRMRASASPPGLLQCLRGGVVNPDCHPRVRAVAWNLSLCQIQSGRHSFHMSTQA